MESLVFFLTMLCLLATSLLTIDHAYQGRRLWRRRKWRPLVGQKWIFTGTLHFAATTFCFLLPKSLIPGIAVLMPLVLLGLWNLLSRGGISNQKTFFAYFLALQPIYVLALALYWTPILITPYVLTLPTETRGLALFWAPGFVTGYAIALPTAALLFALSGWKIEIGHERRAAAQPQP